jgi:hypothetical protein
VILSVVPPHVKRIAGLCETSAHVTEPAPLNCVKDNPVVPKEMGASVFKTQPLSILTVPSSDVREESGVASSLELASTALVQDPAATT